MNNLQFFHLLQVQKYAAESPAFLSMPMQHQHL